MGVGSDFNGEAKTETRRSLASLMVRTAVWRCHLRSLLMANNDPYGHVLTAKASICFNQRPQNTSLSSLGAQQEINRHKRSRTSHRTACSRPRLETRRRASSRRDPSLLHKPHVSQFETVRASQSPRSGASHMPSVLHLRNTSANARFFRRIASRVTPSRTRRPPFV